MSTNEQQATEQVRMLKQCFPQVDESKFTRLLHRHGGDVDQVRARLVQREFRSNKWDTLEARFGPTVTALQQENASVQSLKRARLLKIMERYGGDVDQVRQFLQKNEARPHREGQDAHVSRHQQREEFKTKYASQLAELAKAGINITCPSTFRLLDKQHGDVHKVIEIVSRRAAKKEKFGELDTKYANQIAQLQADDVGIKNKRVLVRLLEKANGQTDVAKQLIGERRVKHSQRKEYQRKHRGKSPRATTARGDDTAEASSSTTNKRRELSADDRDNLKKLRSAGVHGNPKKVLAVFYDCNGSVELTNARIQEEREDRSRHRQERIQRRTLLADVHNAYITLNHREEWPRDIEQVYLDGNNMMFVVNSLRRLCLNRAGDRTERALGEVAAAWNEQMRIPNIELIFDSTRRSDQIGSVKVSSAQPKYRTTDDMLVDLVRQPENRERNKRTIIVTSDRALAVLLQREGCLLVKPYNWFAHCVMVLTPDLIKYEEITGMMTTASSPTTVKIRYNFDELVHRIAHIEI